MGATVSRILNAIPISWPWQASGTTTPASAAADGSNKRKREVSLLRKEKFEGAVSKKKKKLEFLLFEGFG